MINLVIRAIGIAATLEYFLPWEVNQLQTISRFLQTLVKGES
jgi:hypothetical protein